MNNLPSNAGSIKWKNILTGLIVAMIAATCACLAKSFGINSDGTVSLPHIPTKVEIVKSLIAGFSGGLGYVIQKFIKNDVPAAIATVQEAEQKKVDKQVTN